MRALITLLMAFQCTWGAYANEATPLAEDPVVEQRLVIIAEELRCLVCQNESLAGSRADLAMDLRREVRTLIKAGKSDAEIKDFLVSRYGDFVLYKPPVTARTLLLWYGPAGLLAGGFVLLGVILLRRRRKPGVVASGLSADEQQRLAALLNQTPVDKKD